MPFVPFKIKTHSSHLSGVMVAPSALVVNHLLCVDDNMMFFKSSVEGAEEASNLLNVYCQAWGQLDNRDNI